MLKWVKHQSPNVKENKLWKHRSSSLFKTMAARKTPEAEPADMVAAFVLNKEANILTFISPNFVCCTKRDTVRQLSCSPTYAVWRTTYGAVKQGLC